jgi:hypothetical protein
LATTVAASPLPGGGSLTLRLRLPNGQTKRVAASPTDTVADVRARAAAAEDALGGDAPLFLDAACSQLAEDGVDLVSLGLGNGALLFCSAAVQKKNAVTKAANRAEATTSNEEESTASTAGAAGSEVGTAASEAGATTSKTDSASSKKKKAPPTTKAASDATAAKKPLADAFRARGRKLGAGVTRSFEDLSSELSAVKVVRQKAPNCTRLSLDAAASQQLAAYLATKPPPAAATSPETAKPGKKSATSSSSPSSGSLARPRRVALLYGTCRPDDDPKAAPGAQVVTVDAVWEPPQPNATPEAYDARSLCRAAAISPGSTKAGGSGSGGCPASCVAHGLGLRVVGWLFSHPPRAHFLSAGDVRLTAQLQANVETQHGKVAASAFVVVAVRDGAAPHDSKSPPTKTPAEGGQSRGSSKKGAASAADTGVAFEAYQLSSQCCAWLKDGTLKAAADDGDDDDGTALPTSKAVWAEGKETWAVDTAHFAVPAPIVSHRGFLATRFPPANRPERKPTPQLLRRAVFGDASAASTAAPDPAALLKRLADFHLLLYLQKRLPADLGPLLALVQQAGAAATQKKSTKKGSKGDKGGGEASPTLPPYYLAILEELCEPDEN